MGIENIENFNNNFENKENKEFREKNIEEIKDIESLENKHENLENKEVISLKDKISIERNEDINDILEYGLSENYSKLNEEKKEKFKEGGEKLILEIVLMIDKNIEEVFEKSPDKLLEKIKVWLVSGFGNNPYSIQQSKIIFDNLKNKFYK